VRAEKPWRESIAMYRQLAREFPNVADHTIQIANMQVNLGNLLVATGRFAEAEECFREALKLQGDWGRINLARLYHETGRWAEAEQWYLEYLSKERQRAEQQSSAWPQGQTTANIQLELGLLFRQMGKLLEAEKANHEALSLFQNLAKSDNTAFYQQKLGELHDRLGRSVEAERAYRESVGIRSERPEPSRPSRSAQTELCQSLVGLADVLGKRGRAAEAEKTYRQATAIFSELPEDLRNLRKHKALLAHCQTGLGAALHRQDRIREDVEFTSQALLTASRLAADYPQVKIYSDEKELAVKNLAHDVHWLVFDPHRRHRDPKLALDVARRCIDAAPHNAKSWQALGIAYCGSREWSKAIEALGRCIELWKASLLERTHQIAASSACRGPCARMR
jgi:tetratricopeptide (TPR) repeat protein